MVYARELKEEEFPFEKALAAVVSVPAYSFVSFSDGQSYTIVDVDNVPQYLSRLKEECKDMLKRDVAFAMRILEVANALQRQTPITDLDALVLLDAVNLQKQNIQITDPQRHYQRLETLYQQL